MDIERLKKWERENRLSLLMNFLIFFVGSFMAFYCARSLPITKEKVCIKDTVYINTIKQSITDSLLLNISSQLNKIEKKLQPKKAYIQKSRTTPCDTIKIDASIHIKQ